MEIKGVSLILSEDAFYEPNNIIFTEIGKKFYSDASEKLQAGAFVE